MSPQDRGQQVPQPELGGRESARPARQSRGAIQKHKHEERVCVWRCKSKFRNQGIRRKGQPVAHAVMESKTLKYMIRNERRVISTDELPNEVWRHENYPCVCTVDKHILRLRQKLEREPPRPPHFRTVHGAGYKFLP
jgi:DNA-binding response OmpR family regulator